MIQEMCAKQETQMVQGQGGSRAIRMDMGQYVFRELRHGKVPFAEYETISVDGCHFVIPCNIVQPRAWDMKMEEIKSGTDKAHGVCACVQNVRSEGWERWCLHSLAVGAMLKVFRGNRFDGNRY
jgi:hypothetical protein